MRSISNGMRTGENGASAVEFALVLPILVLLIFGIVEFGLAFDAKVTLTHAAREGARMASVGRFNQAVVLQRAYPLQNVTATSVQGYDAALGDFYTVTVSCPYNLKIPLWSSVQLRLSSSARMRKE